MSSELIPADRLPPHDPAAERAVIGAALRDPDCLDDLAPVLGPDDFYLAPHRLVFGVAVRLRGDGKPVDLVTVFDALKAAPGALADAGGPGYLADLLDAAPTAANAAYYAGIVRDAALRRRLIRTCTAVIRDAHAGGPAAADILADAERAVLEIGEAATPAADAADLAAVVKDVLRGIDDRSAGQKTPDPFVRTGFDALDNLIGGFRPGRLYVVGARPSVGKSAMVLYYAIAAAAARVPALLFSLEMDRVELAERGLAIKSGVPLNVISGTAPVPRGLADALAVGVRGFGAKVWVNDRADQTLARVAAYARRAVARQRVGLVALDYLQLLQPASPRDARHLQVAADARGLKVLARQLNVPVVVAAQLSREADARGPDSAPRLSDLKESGGIEENADAVLLLHREPAASGAAEQPIRCTLAKQRGGPTGEFALTYQRACVRFADAHPAA